ncbi:CdaR family protein [Aneurinibacillus sp. REN35]|uniref:CdaR family protein n=1 Tax=Aneurinibacillus sp. REN35 TaxID=3237286 RepID=UPI003527AA87
MMDKWLNNNTFVKVTSFLIAVMLWMVVNNDPATYSPGVGQAQVSTRVTQADLKVRYDARKYLVQAPSTVQVEIRGSKDLLAMSSLLSSDSLDVYVDLRNYGSGKHEVPVQYEGIPRGLEVTVQPRQVSVIIEEIKKLERTVQVDLVGKTQAKGKVGEPIVNPKTVTVTVPESQADNVAFVRAFVSVEGAEESISTKVPLRVLDRRGQPVEAAKISPAVVDVEVPLTSLPAKTVPLRVSTKGAPADGYRIDTVTSNPKEVTVYGSQEVLDTISSVTLPAVDVNDLSESKTVPVKIPLPDKAEKVSAMEANVTVNVVKGDEVATETGAAGPGDSQDDQSEQPVSVRDSVDLPIRIQGLAENQTSEFIRPVSGRIQLQLQGTKEAMERIDKGKLSASVTMDDKPPGQYTTPIQVSNLPPGIKITNEQNLQATVLIKEQADNQHANS